MKKNFGCIMAIAALVMLLSWSGPVFASFFTCTVGGDLGDNYDVTPPNTYACSSELVWDLICPSSLNAQNPGLCSAPVGNGAYVPPSTPNYGAPQAYTNLEISFSNYFLGDLVLVTGWHGSATLFSVGELDPRLGNATVNLSQVNGHYDLLGPGRAVQNVSNINVVHAVDVIKFAHGQTTTHFYSLRLVVSGEGIVPKPYDYNALNAMPQTTSTTLYNSYSYTGPTLLSVLQASGVDTKDMNSYVIVSATDGYATVLSMYEVTHQTGPGYDLLAISTNDPSTINASTGGVSDNGFTRLILPGDLLGQDRWVSNVDQIVVHKIWLWGQK